MDIISRKHYADKVDFWIGKENIIVLVGQRRVGISYILKDEGRRLSSGASHRWDTGVPLVGFECPIGGTRFCHWWQMVLPLVAKRYAACCEAKATWASGAKDVWTGGAKDVWASGAKGLGAYYAS